MTHTRSSSLRPARVAAAALAAAVVLGLVAAVHLHLARRLVLQPELGPPLREALLVLLACLGVALVAGPLAERLLRPPWVRVACFVSYLWMGVLWIALVALTGTDLIFWLMGAAWDSPLEAARARALAAAGVVALGTGVGLRGGLRPPGVRRVALRVPRWPRALDGLRVVQISDLHVGPLLGRAFAADVARRVNELAPDVVAVTGDLVDGSVDRLRDEVAPLGALRARLGVFFVTGNHDAYSGDDAWVARVRELGWRPLRNERVTLGEGDEVFELAGVDDHRGDWVHGSREDLPRALSGWDRRRPLVLLAHDPSTFVAAAREGVDVQLSGHTHGGQIFPFGFLVRLAVPFVAGLHRRGGSQLYVSRGTGFWGPPLRLFAPAEITEITLTGE